MGIKLRTEVGDDPKMSMRYEWFRDLHGLAHDAAVAHALMRAIKDVLGPIAEPLFDEVHDRAAQILRDDFGIEE